MQCFLATYVHVHTYNVGNTAYFLSKVELILWSKYYYAQRFDTNWYHHQGNKSAEQVQQYIAS